MGRKGSLFRSYAPLALKGLEVIKLGPEGKEEQADIIAKISF
jgi:hypothetical protein